MEHSKGIRGGGSWLEQKSLDTYHQADKTDERLTGFRLWKGGYVWAGNRKNQLQGKKKEEKIILSIFEPVNGK